MKSHTYAIEQMGICDARRALEKALNIQFEERDSSWYSAPYFLCSIGKDFELKVVGNRDLEDEVIDDRVEMSAVLLELTVLGEACQFVRILE